MHEYAGAIHIHSTYSDGTGEIPDIARDASDSGLDFIMMSDHNSLRARKDGWEGWRDNVLVIIGYEINDRNDRNHYLAFGLDETVGVRISAQEYVRRVRERGGVGFLAHPDECRNRFPEHPSYPWDAWDSQDFDGIEIWNHMSEWMEGLTEENKFQRFIHPLKSIVAPPAKTLARWDALNLERRVTAIGGVDAHAHKADILGFFDVEVFPYKVMFRSVRTYVWLETALRRNDDRHRDDDARNILDALRSGRSFIANVNNGDPRGFDFHGVRGRRRILSGSDVTLGARESLRLVVSVPARAKLRILHNGTSIEEGTGTELSLRISAPGAYRAEAWKGSKGWIFSNHIRVVGA